MTVETKYGADILKQTQAMAEMVKDMMPKVQLIKMDTRLGQKS